MDRGALQGVAGVLDTTELLSLHSLSAYYVAKCVLNVLIVCTTFRRWFILFCLSQTRKLKHREMSMWQIQDLRLGSVGSRV